jgi:hypothetical protein
MADQKSKPAIRRDVGYSIRRCLHLQEETALTTHPSDEVETRLEVRIAEIEPIYVVDVVVGLEASVT